MVVDLLISCEGARYESIKTFSIIMYVIFPIGLPIALGVLLFRRRRDIEARSSRLGGAALRGCPAFRRR